MATELRAESGTVSIGYAANRLGIGRSTLYRLVRGGNCPAPLKVLRIGERVVIARDSVERALREGTRPEPGATSPPE